MSANTTAPTAAQPARLEARNLVKDFPLRSGFKTNILHAVKDVSFTIEAGKTVALVGESGSGKSTIARMLMKLETPTSGEILLDGKPSGTRGRALGTLPRRRADGVPGPVRVVEPFPHDRASPGAADPPAPPGAVSWRGAGAGRGAAGARAD